jgi:hypothetical protein
VLASVLSVAAIGAVWFIHETKAQADERTKGFLAYGIVGITSGQTARLNAATVGVGHDVPVDLIFLDAQGKVVARAAEKLQPGHAAWLDFHFAPSPAGNRFPIRAVVRWGSTPLGEGYVIPTLEIIDDITGRTLALGADPQG